MSGSYKIISWNPNKIRYDIILWGFNIVFIVLFFAANKFLFPNLVNETIIIRGFGLLAIVLLHVVLSIGPLARLNPSLLPLLYNRRHLGVSMFLIASVHAVGSILWFHGGGNTNPVVSVFTSNTHYDSLIFFPFETLGFAAYVILVILAMTSHDKWLAALKPRVWKQLHMMVYLAYFLLMLHIVLGVIVVEKSIFIFTFLLAGMFWLMAIHLLVAFKERKIDKRRFQIKEGWVKACEVSDVPEGRAVVINVAKERVAIFKYAGKLSAVSNVCKHQLGPLGEGKVVDGCIVCPWHGSRYDPQTGLTPENSKKGVATYRLNVIGNTIFVNPNKVTNGSEVAPIVIGMEINKRNDPFFIGSQKGIPEAFRRSIQLFIFPAALVALSFLFVFSANQQHISPAVFYSGKSVYQAGTIGIDPFPYLRYIDGRDVHGNPVYKILPLVGPGKSGADDIVRTWAREYPGKSCYAKVEGSMLYRSGTQAFVLADGISSLRQEDGPCAPPEIKTLGTDTMLKGEIVDPKCYLGYMNPGEGKTHMSCAIRSISSGIMPVLVWKDNRGKDNFAVLTGMDAGRINEEVLFAVGGTVRVRGVLHSIDNWYWMQIIPSHIRRKEMDTF